VSQLIERRSDDELLELMSNLGGHDMASMIEAFEAIDHDRPVCFIAYTIKASACRSRSKDNHAGLMTVTQMENGAWRRISAPAMNGRSSRDCRWRLRACRRFSTRRRSTATAVAPHRRCRRGARAARVQAVACDVDPAGFWAGAP